MEIVLIMNRSDFKGYYNEELLANLEGCTDIVQNGIINFKTNINFVVSDSVLFLEKINFKIDFLYLDSLDGHDKESASLHQLKEIETSIGKLHKNSLVLLDDKKSKGNLSLKFLLDNKFKILKETEQQVLLSY